MNDRLNVYLSSPYMEFKEIRDKFLSEIQSRNKLYEIRAMEDYLAEDKDVLETCIQDVKNCNIYVLILGDKYGSIAKKDGEASGKSFTYWEYKTANEKKNSGKDIERLILLKAGAPAADENPLLTAWKKEIGASQIQTVYYETQDEIPQIILDSLDNFTRRRLMAYIQKKDVIKDKIYLCNRNEINLELVISIDNDPIQFFVLSGHTNHLPQYFIKRQEIEYADSGTKWNNITIKPSIPEAISVFEKAESYVWAAIYEELKSRYKKFKNFKDVTPETIIQYMSDNNIDYLSISWYIKSALWKNDNLKKFIVSFYEHYNIINANLKSDKHIMFFAILTYVPNDNITEEEFYGTIKNIQWEHNLPKFSKITKDDIKDWLSKNEIEETEMRSEELISLYLNEVNQSDLYYTEVEGGLNKMLDLYNN